MNKNQMNTPDTETVYTLRDDIVNLVIIQNETSEGQLVHLLTEYVNGRITMEVILNDQIVEEREVISLNVTDTGVIVETADGISFFPADRKD
jgi:mannitol-1-phosphate/altronate dehydrogenase